MKIHKLTCPNCNANLPPVDENLKQCFCQYCGTKILIDNGSTTHTYREIDEAKIKEVEAQQTVELKKLEIEEQKRKDRTKLILIIICVIIGLPILSSVFNTLFSLFVIFFLG